MCDSGALNRSPFGEQIHHLIGNSYNKTWSPFSRTIFHQPGSNPVCCEVRWRRDDSDQLLKALGDWDAVFGPRINAISGWLQGSCIQCKLGISWYGPKPKCQKGHQNQGIPIWIWYVHCCPRHPDVCHFEALAMLPKVLVSNSTMWLGFWEPRCQASTQPRVLNIPTICRCYKVWHSRAFCNTGK